MIHTITRINESLCRMFVETNIADSPVGLFVVGIGVVDSTRPVIHLVVYILVWLVGLEIGCYRRG